MSDQLNSEILRVKERKGSKPITNMSLFPFFAPGVVEDGSNAYSVEKDNDPSGLYANLTNWARVASEIYLESPLSSQGVENIDTKELKASSDLYWAQRNLNDPHRNKSKISQGEIAGVGELKGSLEKIKAEKAELEDKKEMLIDCMIYGCDGTELRMLVDSEPEGLEYTNGRLQGLADLAKAQYAKIGEVRKGLVQRNLWDPETNKLIRPTPPQKEEAPAEDGEPKKKAYITYKKETGEVRSVPKVESEVVDPQAAKRAALYARQRNLLTQYRQKYRQEFWPLPYYLFTLVYCNTNRDMKEVAKAIGTPMYEETAKSAMQEVLKKQGSKRGRSFLNFLRTILNITAFPHAGKSPDQELRDKMARKYGVDRYEMLFPSRREESLDRHEGDTARMEEAKRPDVARRIKHFATPQSSNIDNVMYDVASKELTVLFKSGAEYVYYDVPETVYNDFQAAPSAGTFLNNNIKGPYDYAKIDDAVAPVVAVVQAVPPMAQYTGTVVVEGLNGENNEPYGYRTDTGEYFNMPADEQDMMADAEPQEISINELRGIMSPAIFTQITGESEEAHDEVVAGISNIDTDTIVDDIQEAAPNAVAPKTVTLEDIMDLLFRDDFAPEKRAFVMGGHFADKPEYVLDRICELAFRDGVPAQICKDVISGKYARGGADASDQTALHDLFIALGGQDNAEAYSELIAGEISPEEFIDNTVNGAYPYLSVNNGVETLITPISEWLDSVAYDSTNKVLYVSMKSGHCYGYRDVPQSVMDGFKDVVANGKSAGSFFNSNVKKAGYDYFLC